MIRLKTLVKKNCHLTSVTSLGSDVVRGQCWSWFDGKWTFTMDLSNLLLTGVYTPVAKTTMKGATCLFWAIDNCTYIQTPGVIKGSAFCWRMLWLTDSGVQAFNCQTSNQRTTALPPQPWSWKMCSLEAPLCFNRTSRMMLVKCYLAKPSE